MIPSPDIYPGTIIKKGNNGPIVEKIQKALLDFFIIQNLEIPESIQKLPQKEGDPGYGNFGPLTEKAVEDFQLYNNFASNTDTPSPLGTISKIEWNVLFPLIPRLPTLPTLPSISLKFPSPEIRIAELKELDFKKKFSFKREKLINGPIKNPKEALPESLKPKGKEELSIIMLDIGQSLKEKVVPMAFNLIQEYGINLLEQKLEEQGISTTDLTNPLLLLEKQTGGLNLDSIKKQFCPTPDNLKKIVDIRNNITGFLNKSSDKLERTLKSVNSASTVANTLQDISSTLSLVALSTNIALAAIPPTAVPGAVPAAINTVNEANNKIKFDKEGVPRLPPLLNVASQVSVAVSTVSTTIAGIVIFLGSIDLLINLCNPFETLTPIQDNTKLIASTQQSANNSENNNSYKGFIIETETIPFSPTVNRMRAIGKNSSGIIIIQTNLSFTTNIQTLINELKLIIDRDNLKAY